MNQGLSEPEPEPESGSSPVPAELAQLAVVLATRAGELMSKGRAAGFSITTKSSATDVVTNVDRDVERFLVTELARMRPGDSVMAEEGTQGRSSGSAVRWVIDPIDGTVNFVLGLPHYAVSIAAQLGGRTVAGCVLNPVSGEVFHASLGGGAFLEGGAALEGGAFGGGAQRLSGPRQIPMKEAVVATGFAYDAAVRGRQGRVLAEVLPKVGNIRRFGSAALDLCALAAGQVDAYFEHGLNEWDYAAGALIAEEAGVALSGLHGRALGTTMAAGANVLIASEFFRLLADVGADLVGQDR